MWDLPLPRLEFAGGQTRQIGGWSGTEHLGQAAKLGGNGIARFFHVGSLLSSAEVRGILDCAERRSADYMTIADAVDNDPTFEYYPFVEGEWYDEGMESILGTALESRILPYLRERYDCRSLSLAAALLRRYVPGERRKHDMHFDTQAYVTAVVGLCDPDEFEGGLFLQPGPHASSRFFPRLEQGDLLAHSFDIQHGVHVAGGVRHSLILWFGDTLDAACERTTPWLEPMAASGDPHAQHLLAEALEYGEAGRRQDLKKAFELYTRSAEAGHWWSMTSLGYMHQTDPADNHAGLPLDWAASKEWFRKAAELGFAQAQRLTALACLDAEDGEPDYIRAAVWMHRAAEQLDVEAAHMLGEFLFFGSPDGKLSPDRAKAKMWLRRSASMGFEKSKELLAVFPDAKEAS